MAVDHEMVARVARLARLRLAPAEVAPLAAELNRILGWIDQLQAVDTEGVAPLETVIPITRAWREDVVTEGDCQADLLANAPAAAHGFFAVPKVIE
ncbi:MAG: Asp-tRNA(Asn)/Glu-tRNA(Gln) amidotransferase subunit GatC [Thermaurantiacus tibetensis]|uniref:Asp-tRNA(Asn)/Glu-tRNA(Gln) amidotransferase subunit GatC n=1 Tax=Thermaurantiacus tibetensis TaxID=2759035 RepID=UPI00188DF150|nr:Asp-tRNA(Asn)/Glu-tRNA(Gln) amidotransferase subunit GatC [Thermaurantiacus tibetensis]